MRKWYPILLMLAIVLLSACGRKPPEKPAADGPTLADVRKQAQTALDANLPSKERGPARDKAMNLLVQLLKRPESLLIPKAEWEKPFDLGQLRYFEAGAKVRAYAAVLPGSGIVPPGERVALQFNGAGLPQANEVEVMPGGQLVGARQLDDKSVMLVFSLARGGGYVGYYQRNSRTGDFEPDPAVFRGLPTNVDEVRLEPRGNFLLIDVPYDSAWSPQFDKSRPQRFYMNADLGLEWKNKFTLVDERNFTAFQGFTTAANAGLSKEERLEAWEKATRKLPAYLQQLESVQESLLPRLPAGSAEQIERASNLTVRVISIPAPVGLGRPGFTIIQHRVGNGMPMATVPTLPGPVEAVRVVEVEGLPGLSILSAAEGGKGHTVSLLRINGANDWEPAPEWFGFLPPADGGLKVQRGPGKADLTLEVTDPKGSVAVKPDGALQVCRTAADCFTITWVGGRFSAADLVAARVRQIAAASLPTQAEVLQAAEVVKQYLQTPEAANLTATEMAAMTGARGWDFGRSKLLAFPSNSAGLMPLIVQAGKTVLVESYTPRTVTQWVEAREVQAGGKRWLQVLGRATASASLVLYEWRDDAWQPANPLAQDAHVLIGPSTRILYKAGQTDPIRGLYASGSTDLKVSFMPGGNGVAFCEGARPCVVYQFANQWVLQ